ncbi:uncharacterized protein LOC101178486 [Nomascus leucogenys]|uniref:uncharacterized protein LOC101178486 n=1 Tax=Nomascus leucogenys TaxID=61853 RepID=UPI00122D6417|nr:uncharacterized protein LOC101178486 [Nomascus leucogenys]
MTIPSLMLWKVHLDFSILDKCQLSPEVGSIVLVCSKSFFSAVISLLFALNTQLCGLSPRCGGAAYLGGSLCISGRKEAFVNTVSTFDRSVTLEPLPLWFKTKDDCDCGGTLCAQRSNGKWRRFPERVWQSLLSFPLRPEHEENLAPASWPTSVHLPQLTGLHAALGLSSAAGKSRRCSAQTVNTGPLLDPWNRDDRISCLFLIIAVVLFQIFI